MAGEASRNAPDEDSQSCVASSEYLSSYTSSSDREDNCRHCCCRSKELCVHGGLVGISNLLQQTEANLLDMNKLLSDQQISDDDSKVCFNKYLGEANSNGNYNQEIGHQKQTDVKVLLETKKNGAVRKKDSKRVKEVPETDEAKLGEILSLLQNVARTVSSYEQHPLLNNISKIESSSIENHQPIYEKREQRAGKLVQTISSHDNHAIENGFSISGVTEEKFNSGSKISNGRWDTDLKYRNDQKATIEKLHGNDYSTNDPILSFRKCDMENEMENIQVCNPLHTSSLRKAIDNVVARKSELDKRLEQLALKRQREDFIRENVEDDNFVHPVDDDDLFEVSTNVGNKLFMPLQQQRLTNCTFEVTESLAPKYLEAPDEKESTRVKQKSKENAAFQSCSREISREVLSSLQSDESSIPGLEDLGLSGEINSLNKVMEKLTKENTYLRKKLMRKDQKKKQTSKHEYKVYDKHKNNTSDDFKDLISEKSDSSNNSNSNHNSNTIEQSRRTQDLILNSSSSHNNNLTNVLIDFVSELKSIVNSNSACAANTELSDQINSTNVETQTDKNQSELEMSLQEINSNIGKVSSMVDENHVKTLISSSLVPELINVLQNFHYKTVTNFSTKRSQTSFDEPDIDVENKQTQTILKEEYMDRISREECRNCGRNIILTSGDIKDIRQEEYLTVVKQSNSESSSSASKSSSSPQNIAKNLGRTKKSNDRKTESLESNENTFDRLNPDETMEDFEGNPEENSLCSNFSCKSQETVDDLYSAGPNLKQMLRMKRLLRKFFDRSKEDKITKKFLLEHLTQKQKEVSELKIELEQIKCRADDFNSNEETQNTDAECLKTNQKDETKSKETQTFVPYPCSGEKKLHVTKIKEILQDKVIISENKWMPFNTDLPATLESRGNLTKDQVPNISNSVDVRQTGSVSNGMNLEDERFDNLKTEWEKGIKRWKNKCKRYRMQTKLLECSEQQLASLLKILQETNLKTAAAFDTVLVEYKKLNEISRSKINCEDRGSIPDFPEPNQTMVNLMDMGRTISSSLNLMRTGLNGEAYTHLHHPVTLQTKPHEWLEEYVNQLRLQRKVPEKLSLSEESADVAGTFDKKHKGGVRPTSSVNSSIERMTYDTRVNERMTNETKVKERMTNDTGMNERMTNDTKMKERMTNDTGMNERMTYDTSVYERMINDKKVNDTGHERELFARDENDYQRRYSSSSLHKASYSSNSSSLQSEKRPSFNDNADKTKLSVDKGNELSYNNQLVNDEIEHNKTSDSSTSSQEKSISTDSTNGNGQEDGNTSSFESELTSSSPAIPPVLNAWTDNNNGSLIEDDDTEVPSSVVSSGGSYSADSEIDYAARTNMFSLKEQDKNKSLKDIKVAENARGDVDEDSKSKIQKPVKKSVTFREFLIRPATSRGRDKKIDSDKDEDKDSVKDSDEDDFSVNELLPF